MVKHRECYEVIVIRGDDRNRWIHTSDATGAAFPTICWIFFVVGWLTGNDYVDKKFKKAPTSKQASPGQRLHVVVVVDIEPLPEVTEDQRAVLLHLEVAWHVLSAKQQMYVT